MDFEKKLEELGFVLPVATKPLGSYVPYKIVGNMVHLSGKAHLLKDSRYTVAKSVEQFLRIKAMKRQGFVH